MRIGSVADVHLGNHRRQGGITVAGLNERCLAILSVIRAAIARAVKEKCDFFAVVGDLYDVQRPEPQVIAALQAVLLSSPIPVLLMLGNHDMVSNARGDHALGPHLMEKAGATIRVIEQPTVIDSKDAQVVLLPFLPHVAGAHYVSEALRDLLLGGAPRQGVPRLVLLHLGISDETTVSFLRGSADSIEADKLMRTCATWGVNTAIAGNWHTRKQWVGKPRGAAEVTITQCGALVPTGWDNLGADNYGGLVIWDSKDQSTTIIEMPGPRFFVERSQAAAMKRIKQCKSKGHTPYIELRVAPEDVGSGLLNVSDTDGTTTMEVRADRAQVEAAARSAAYAARSSKTLEDAMQRFVGAMQLENGVDRAQVLQLAKGFLNGRSA
jgi:hypothetical protein